MSSFFTGDHLRPRNVRDGTDTTRHHRVIPDLAVHARIQADATHSAESREPTQENYERGFLDTLAKCFSCFRGNPEVGEVDQEHGGVQTIGGIQEARSSIYATEREVGSRRASTQSDVDVEAPRQSTSQEVGDSQQSPAQSDIHKKTDLEEYILESVIIGNNKKIDVEGDTVGISRTDNGINQDALFIDKDNLVIGVFDGEGSTDYPHKASQKARNIVRDSSADFPNTEDGAKTAMRELLLKAHDAIKELHPEVFPVRRPRTTATVLKVLEVNEGWIGVIGNSGDSRVYVLRNGSEEIEHLTIDGASDSDIKGENSQYNIEKEKKYQKILANVSNTKDMENYTNEVDIHFYELSMRFRSRNQTCNTLGYLEDNGVEITPDPAIYSCPFKLGDRVVISTDGLHDNLTDKEIAAILQENPSNKEATKALIEKAQQVMNKKTPGMHIQRSKYDDITLAVITIGQN